eukprot:4011561-Amphidinium_carterae.3
MRSSADQTSVRKKPLNSQRPHMEGCWPDEEKLMYKRPLFDVEWPHWVAPRAAVTCDERDLSARAHSRVSCPLRQQECTSARSA